MLAVAGWLEIQRYWNQRSSSKYDLSLLNDGDGGEFNFPSVLVHRQRLKDKFVQAGVIFSVPR